MPKIQAIWAIDIGQAALKALKLVPGPNLGLRAPDLFQAGDFLSIFRGYGDIYSIHAQTLKTGVEQIAELRGDAHGRACAVRRVRPVGIA